MSIYFFLFFVLVFLNCNQYSLKAKLLFFKIFIIILAIFVGCSDMLGGYDRYIYGSLFDATANTLRTGNNVFKSPIFNIYNKEIGFCFLNIAISVITSNRYIYILLITILFYILLYRAIKYNTKNPLFALLIYMALMFFFSFTYLRQMLAAVLVWQSLKYIQMRNFKIFFLWILAAFSVHNSAIIFFPIYFISLRKIRLLHVWVLMFICLLLGVTGIPSALFEAFGSVSDSASRTEGYTIDAGFRIAYFFESIIFCSIISKYYKFIGNDKKSLLNLNIAITFCLILLIFIKSENAGRLSWYFLIGIFAILSGIKKKLHNIFLLYILLSLLYIRILLSWGVLLYPYKTFFSNGVRKGDYIHMKYEYDHRYNSNKFYKL